MLGLFHPSLREICGYHTYNMLSQEENDPHRRPAAAGDEGIFERGA